MRHLISLKEQTRGDLVEILNLALQIKKSQEGFSNTEPLKNKTLVMLFQKGSTRTRLSFEAGMTRLGGHAIFLDQRSTQFSLARFEDEIRAVMQYGDILMFRALKASNVELAASYNIIPVIDACSEKFHPCQTLADILTMIEYSDGRIDKIGKVVWLGIQNNVSNTLKLACSKLGINLMISSPYTNPSSIDHGLELITGEASCVRYQPYPESALGGANYVHTDTWMDMEYFKDGEVKPEFRKEFDTRREMFKPYQLSRKFIDENAPDARIMHCMPCHEGYEISLCAIAHPNSLIFQQAKNRMYIQQAIICWLLGIEIA